MAFLLETVRLGLKNLRLHILRSILTALGIILGVAAVITMVSIGEGSKQEALEQIERLGARNIIVRSQKPPESAQAGGGGQQASWVSRYGLTRSDLRVLETAMSHALHIAPLKAVGGQVLKENRRITSQAFGVTPELSQIANLRVARGRYITQGDLQDRAMVAVVGQEAARAIFPFVDPLGNTLRIDDKVFTVVGVLAPVGLSGGAGSALVGRDLNLDVHIPLTTAELAFGDIVVRQGSGSQSASEVQVEEIYIESASRESVIEDAALVERTINQRHENKQDVSIIVPYELLESAKKTAMTWSLVLGAVAGIALLVGGIGIMNIMLATVTERTREIGIRRALGATRKNITWQFLVETGVLSAIGGVIGVGLGIGLSVLIGWGVPRLPDAPFIGSFFPADVTLPTQVTMWSILVSFGVATATGLLFGIYPARVAARQDPIVALRHD